MKHFRLFAALFADLALASCKLRIIVPEGGNVESQSGAHFYSSSRTCDIDIDIVDFASMKHLSQDPQMASSFSPGRKMTAGFAAEN